jgi:Uma2 family endonuclease
VTTATLPAPLAIPFPVLETDHPDIPPFPIYRLSVHQYHEMAKFGILAPEDRIELIDGWLVPKMTKHRPHTVSTHRLRVALEEIVGKNFYIGSQDSLSTSDSEPEPDAMVVRGAVDDYDEQPTAADVPLASEVSESSLNFDRTHKKRIYAAARIPVYWIVNLVDQQVEVYTDPTGPAPNPTYRQCRIFGSTEEVPVEIHGVEVGRIAVRDLLP